MANKMLIDATHPEETRVAVVRGNRLEEFDFESASRKPLRGNIYLAKVTRVEPSLQAAFIEYGGNRHGFLAFSEIHPDYYQIPVADRQALLEEEARAEREEDEENERPRGGNRRRRGRNRNRNARNGETVSAEAGSDSEERDETAAAGDEAEADALDAAGEDRATSDEDRDEDRAASQDQSASADDEDGDDEDDDAEENGEDEDETVEQVGTGDALDEMPERRRQARKQYKIQEVIKRRQIMLVQVVKEERGNKGAALTTYLSLAGRYSVLMPNSGRGGGISRKITSAEDRRRLKEVVQDLDVPEGMGIILRTAGASRTKSEIRRDYEYLMRMWDSVRELTLSSSAPALVYEEGSLIKRSIRDLYGREVDEVVVAGETAYREAKDFMRMLMPSHIRAVKPWRENQPVFARSGVETQLDGLYSNTVTLRSGGYLVINQTEALVAIDINSGRSTREHNIEDTALKTNLEAADEIARQLRLRDLAGLVVIDFIDMEEKRNNRAVEKRLKDALKNDRARIQVGRISPFGLMEMSRQRMRTGMMESSSIPCPHCSGTGLVRSHQSAALQVLRAIEEALARNPNHNVTVKTRANVAMYLLNQKRASLRDIEGRFGLTITVEIDPHQSGQTYHVIERGEFVPEEIRAAQMRPVNGLVADAVDEDEDDIVEDIPEEEDGDEVYGAPSSAARDDDGETDEDGRGENGQRRKRRRRRRRRGGREGENGIDAGGTERDDQDEDAEGGSDEEDAADGEGREAEARDGEGRDGEGREGGRRRRRRGRRGGRRFREGQAGEGTEGGSDEAAGEESGEDDAENGVTAAEVEAKAEPAEAEMPKPRARRGRKKAEAETVAVESVAEEALPVEVEAEPAPKPKRGRAAKAKAAPVEETTPPVIEAEPVVEPVEEAAAAAPPAEPVHMVLTEADPNRPRRGGWWSKKS